MGEDLTFRLSNTQSITDPGRFTQLLGTSMDEIETRASNAPSSATKFATTEAKFSDLQTLYSLVQCDPLLSSSDCNRCLRTLIGYLPSCCAGKQGVVRLVGHTVGGGTWLWVTLEVEDERVAMGFGFWLELLHHASLSSQRTQTGKKSLRRNRRRPYAAAADLTLSSKLDSPSLSPQTPQTRISTFSPLFSEPQIGKRIWPPNAHGQPLSFYSNPPLSSLFLSYPSSQTSKRIRPPTAHAVPPPIPPHPFSQSVNSLLSLCHSHPPPISSPLRTTDPITHLFKVPIFSRKCDIGIQAIRKAKRAYETLEKKLKERRDGSLRAFENLGKKWNCKREEGSEKMDMLLTAANTLNYEEKLAAVQTDLQKG
ncbi:cysteine-rich receptor-like protein kinase 25 [Quercus suber]|uniref:Cysteine-rich receptor-like protein kinase 25 n=1 Tax=Quercus suber TaxID=58331 RepID=A0AAW0KSC6_QUESU